MRRATSIFSNFWTVFTLLAPPWKKHCPGKPAHRPMPMNTRYAHDSDRARGFLSPGAKSCPSVRPDRYQFTFAGKKKSLVE